MIYRSRDRASRWLRPCGRMHFRKCIFRKFCKFLAGSFSAVSKRNFARKYAFDSIFQALQDLHSFAPLQSQNVRKKSVWKSSNFRENSAKLLQMSQNLQNVAKFQKIQLDNLVDFEKCCKTRIFLQRSAPIQPKTIEILPKICQKLATTLRVHSLGGPESDSGSDGILRRKNGPAAGCRVTPPQRGDPGGRGRGVASLDRAYFTGLILGCIEAKYSK